MSVSTICPHCHTRVTMWMIEACKEAVCLKSCQVKEVDWSEFGALSGEAATEPMPLLCENTESTTAPDCEELFLIPIRHIV